MYARHTRFRPFGASGRWTIAAIMLAFTLYTGLSLVLSARTATRSENKARVIEIAARQRTLTERYAKEVLLGARGSPSAAMPIAHDLKQSAAALLNGGTAPAVAGDDDEAELAPLTGSLARLQLRQEQSLIHDLVATGEAMLARQAAAEADGARAPAADDAAARASDGAHRADVQRLPQRRALDRRGERPQHVAARFAAAPARSSRARRLRDSQLGARHEHAAPERAFPEPCDVDDRPRARVLGRAVQVREQLGAADDRLRRRRDVLGDGIIDFVHHDDRQTLRDVLRAGEAATVAFRLPDTERGWRSLEANVTDLRDDRHVRGIVLNARDVTERNRIETERELLLEQEQLANERLREADRLKDEFVALVSHEVRTPLTSILGYLELLSEQELSADQRTYTDIIDRNSGRLLRLINDLLFIAEIEDGQLTVEHDEIDLGVDHRGGAGGCRTGCRRRKRGARRR